jgi:methylmalonyl-CoA/ethylmalonyl-CoA epimerase
MFWNISGIVQVAFAVNDLDAEMKRWRAKGTGEFVVFRDLDVPLNVRGDDVTLKLSIGLAQFDGVQIELIQQHNDAASPFMDTFAGNWPDGDNGFHHVGMVSDDFDSTCAKYVEDGYTLAMSGAFGGYRIAYFDTREKLGFFLELFEGNDAQRELFDSVRNA